MAYGDSKTYRNKIKWVKVTHLARNKYAVACGFNSEIKEADVRHGGKIWAEAVKENWLKDI